MIIGLRYVQQKLSLSLNLLHPVHRRIRLARSHQFVVGALLNDDAIGEYANQVRIPNRRQTMRNRYARSAR